jgi:hypothetical protein
MSETFGCRDPPWGALSPLHAAGRQRSARQHPHSDPTEGTAWAGWRSARLIGPSPTQSERNDRRSRPTLGCALTVATPLGGNIRRDSIRTRAHRRALRWSRWRPARSIGAGPTARLSETFGSRDPPWGALSPLHAAGQQRSARRHPHSGLPTGFALRRLALGSVAWSGPDSRRSETFDGHDPPWGALSPLHAAGRHHSARRHPHSGPPTGIALEPLAPGSVDWSGPDRQKERNVRLSRPTLGRALTVTRCWAATFRATASALGPTDGDCPAAAGARLGRLERARQQKERNVRRSRPTLRRTLTVAHGWAATFGATASALGPTDGERAGRWRPARSIGAGPTGRMSETFGCRDPPWGALSPLRAAGQQHSARRHPHSGPTDGHYPGAAGARPSVDWSGPPKADERNDRLSRPTLGRALTVTRGWAASFGATASALGPTDGHCAGAAGARLDRLERARQPD